MQWNTLSTQRSPFSRFLSAGLLAAVLALVPASCSDDDSGEKETQKDALGDGMDSGPAGDTVPADEPFGRACTEIGQACPDEDLVGYPLDCVGISGGAEGQGFCTRSCTDVGNECYGVPNGQTALCIMQGPSAGDAGTAGKYCAFVCQYQGLTWSCPQTLHCGEPDEQGTGICVP